MHASVGGWFSGVFRDKERDNGRCGKTPPRSDSSATVSVNSDYSTVSEFQSCLCVVRMFFGSAEGVPYS